MADSEGAFDPTFEEMEQYKQRMGITSSMPSMGRAQSASGWYCPGLQVTLFNNCCRHMSMCVCLLPGLRTNRW
jgi:hypothetical protein